MPNFVRPRHGTAIRLARSSRMPRQSTSNAIRPASRRRSAAIALVCGLLFPGSALACNPIEALFGACRFEPLRPIYESPSYHERFRAAPRLRHVRRPQAAHVRKTARRRNESGISGKESPLLPTLDAPVGSLALFRRDPTLRNGDIVVTNDGFRVYRHGKFASIRHDGGKIARLEQASMRGRPRPGRRQSIADRRP